MQGLAHPLLSGGAGATATCQVAQAQRRSPRHHQTAWTAFSKATVQMERRHITMITSVCRCGMPVFCMHASKMIAGSGGAGAGSHMRCT